VLLQPANTLYLAWLPLVLQFIENSVVKAFGFGIRRKHPEKIEFTGGILSNSNF
jgi:hypothetical protein